VIVTERGVLNSSPIYEGTRIPVRAVASFIVAGKSNDEILSNYPSLHVNEILLTRKLIRVISRVQKRYTEEGAAVGNDLTLSSPSETPGLKYPATLVYYWPLGPVFCCERHSAWLEARARKMGWSLSVAALKEPEECGACIDSAQEADATPPTEEQ